MSKKYNGHKNWNHWNVSLWINNDESLYRAAMDFIKFTSTREAAARAMLSWLPEKTPDGAKYSMTSILAAMVGM